MLWSPSCLIVLRVHSGHGLRDELHMLVTKQVSHPEPRYKVLGFVGLAALVAYANCDPSVELRRLSLGQMAAAQGSPDQGQDPKMRDQWWVSTIAWEWPARSGTHLTILGVGHGCISIYISVYGCILGVFFLPCAQFQMGARQWQPEEAGQTLSFRPLGLPSFCWP